MASIFISYRREDTGGHAGRLCDRLTARFGGDRVFLDIQDIRPGENFATSIEDTIATCDCVIAVIGPRWLEAIRKRAQSSDDFVRHEISAALKRHVTVIPVLMGGARMPAAAELPPELAGLSHINAIEVRDERFNQDVAELEALLATRLQLAGAPDAGERRRRPRGFIWAMVAIAAALASAAYFLTRPPAKVAVDAAVEPAPVIDGDWIAEMRRSGQPPPYRVCLRFQRAGDQLGGTVRYPTGDGAMVDVKLAGRTLTFYTMHVPQFESAPATIRFQAEVRAEQITLLATDNAGVATGVATRAAGRSCAAGR